VPETQAKDVALGQRVAVDTRTGTGDRGPGGGDQPAAGRTAAAAPSMSTTGVIPGRVTRVDPGVQNGTVTVEVALDPPGGQLPRGARADLSVDGTIELERLPDVLSVGRPAYGQPESTVGLFRLSPDGAAAQRVQVVLGRASVTAVEVVRGLNPGDRVIVSDVSQWDAHDRLRINFPPPPVRMATTAPAPASYTPTSGDPPLLRMDSVQKVFLTDEVETHALSDVHLEIRRGEYVTIAGPSGCGKTTLLSILGLLDSPSGGRYELAGQDVTSLDAGQRARVRNRQIGFIFQAFNLIGDLTVFENVELPLTYRSGEHALNAAERRRRVHDALERVGMSHRQKHYPAQLSGGQQQRVAVARAVVGDPSILLADEPTGNLDSANGESVMELLRELHRGGATVCMVTHDPRYAQHAERTVHLFDGRVVEETRNDGSVPPGPAPV
jgi:putative ABC transport system ATP-binding protein